MREQMKLLKHSAGRLRWLWAPLLALLVTRLLVAAAAYFSTPILEDSNIPGYHERPDAILLDALCSRWDTGFYVSIATEGYRYEGVQFPSVAFFPLLPMLMRAVMLVTGDPLTAGVLVSNLALAGAALLYYRLVADQGGEQQAERAVWYLLLFPASFFGSAVYSESLFLLFSIAALLLARRKRWLAAALCASLAGLTRLVGILVFGMLLVEWWQQRRRESPEQRPGLRSLAWLGVAPLGTATYLLYLQLVFGDALAFLRASAAWARQPSSPWSAVASLFERPQQGWSAALESGALPLDNWLDLSFVLLFLGLGLALLLRRRWSEAAFVLAGVLLPISSGMLMSQRRYMWVLFPGFTRLAEWGENPWVDRVVVSLSAAGLGLFTALFSNWYWVA